ncbi:MAG: hypothetical protein ACO25F_11060 [Erythrobacter sp.]
MSYLLIALFSVVGLAAAVSLTDSALRFVHAWQQLKPQAARVQVAPRMSRAGVPGGVVVVMRQPPAAPVRQRPVLAAAA